MRFYSNFFPSFSIMTMLHMDITIMKFPREYHKTVYVYGAMLIFSSWDG